MITNVTLTYTDDGFDKSLTFGGQLYGFLITDGFGNWWNKHCPKCGAKIQIVRPGYAKCPECDE